jgi:hypothetical protein
VIGFEAAGAKMHLLDGAGGIEFVRGEGVGDPAEVNQRRPQGEESTGGRGRG